jgi:hypothetical protein
VEYVVVEDTGKLWPLCGLKLGFLCTSIGSRLPVGAASADLLLTVSPFVARLVEELATDMANGGMRQMHELIAGNRAIVGEALDGFAAAALAEPPFARWSAGASASSGVRGPSSASCASHGDRVG